MTDARRVLSKATTSRTIVDAVGLLAGSAAWSQAHQMAITVVVCSISKLVALRAPKGALKRRRKTITAAGMTFKLLRLVFSRGRRDFAHRVLSEIPRKRIARQIKPDGSQPLELARTHHGATRC